MENDSNKLSEILEDLEIYTCSNTIPIPEEIKRYNEIAEYFLKKSNRERFNSVNEKYLREIHDRLLVLQGETLPEEIVGLCSKVIKKFEDPVRGII